MTPLRSIPAPLTLLLAACTGCMAPSTPSTPNSPWTPPASARNPDTSWQQLRATIPPDPAKPLTLADAADRALQNHPACGKAWNDARAAAAQVRQAQGYFMPTLTASASASHSQTDANPSEFDSESLKWAPALQMNYLVLNFGGGRQAAVEAALQTVYALNFTFNRTIQDVLLSVETAYHGLVSATAALDAAQQSVKDSQAALDAATTRRDNGLGTELDVLQAKARYDQALYARATVNGQLMTARGALAFALGLPADTPLQIVPPARETPDPLTETDLRQLIDASLTRRPDIAALRASLAAKEALVKVTDSPRWPSLYLNGTAAANYFDQVTGKPAQDSDLAYSAGISLQWTLFDGFQTTSARRAAASHAESVRAQLRQAELAASADVWAKFQSYQTALQKFTFSAAFQKSAASAHELALAAFNNGLKTILDLLTAETQLAQARLQCVAARQEAFLALAQLAHATGLLAGDNLEPQPASLSTTNQKDLQP